MKPFRVPDESDILRISAVTAVAAAALVPVALSLGYLFSAPWLHRLWAVFAAVTIDAGLVAGVTPTGRRAVVDALARIRWGIPRR